MFHIRFNVSFFCCLSVSRCEDLWNAAVDTIHIYHTNLNSPTNVNSTICSVALWEVRNLLSFTLESQPNKINYLPCIQVSLKYSSMCIFFSPFNTVVPSLHLHIQCYSCVDIVVRIWGLNGLLAAAAITKLAALLWKRDSNNTSGSSFWLFTFFPVSPICITIYW